MFELYTQSHAATLELHLVMIAINIHYCVHYTGIIWTVYLFSTLEYGMHAQTAQSPTVFSAMRVIQRGHEGHRRYTLILCILLTVSQLHRSSFVIGSTFIIPSVWKNQTENGIIIRTAKNIMMDDFMMLSYRPSSY